MHYKDGMPAKVGDIVRGPTHSTSYLVTGRVIALCPTSTTCNVTIAHVGLGNYSDYVSMQLAANYNPEIGSTQVIVVANSAVANANELELVKRKE